MSMWDLGDYAIVGDWFADASRSVLDGGAMPADFEGVSVLDIACGTGAVAIEAGRRGAAVTGLDDSVTMLTTAAHRAAAAGVQARWVQRSFDDLSGLDRAQVVTSALGVMFAQDPVAAAAGLDSVTESDGVIGVTAWHPEGSFGSAPSQVIEWLGALPVDYTAWADPERVASFFAGTGRAVAHSRRDVARLRFESVDDAISQFRVHSAPWIPMFERLGELGLVDEAVAHWRDYFEQHVEAEGSGIVLRADYVVTHLT